MSTVSAPTQVPSNALTAFAYLIKKGLNPAQAAGIVGNLWQESGLNPNANNPSEGAMGIAQWEGGRRTNLYAFANQVGTPANDFNTQLDFLWYELTGSESASLSDLKQTNTPGSAAATFAANYERCQGCASGGGSVPNRVTFANTVYAVATGQTAPGGTPQIVTGQPGNSGTGVEGPVSSTGASPVDDCQVKIPLPSLGPIGGGSVCLWHTGWSRALLGGACLVAGGVMVLTGVALLAGKNVTPVPVVNKVQSNFATRRQNTIDVNRGISSGNIKFPERPANLKNRNLTTGKFVKKGTFG